MAQDRIRKLTIAITTRNRATFIGETLDSILPQLTAEVELLVLDGASTDNTPEVIAQYQHRCPALRYVRLHANNGPDRDFNNSVEMSSAEYCWLMTDDDLLHPEAVRAVLGAIDQDEPSLIIVNAEVRNADLSKVLEPRRLSTLRDESFDGAERERLFVRTASYLSFIGAVVIKRRVWLERDRESYFGSLFVHFGVIFQHALPGTARIIAEPLISIRYGNALWRSAEFEVWMFKWPALVWSFAGISDRAKESVCRLEPWRKLTTLIFLRAKGSYSYDTYRTWICPRVKGFARRMSAAIACLPGPLTNMLAVLYCSTVRRGSPMMRIELRNSRYHFRNWLAGAR